MPPLEQGILEEDRGNYDAADSVFTAVLSNPDATRSQSYPLMQLMHAHVNFCQGDYRDAVGLYRAAARNLTIDVGAVDTGVQLMVREANRKYRGVPHELSALHYYAGLCYFQMDEYENARIELAQAREEDKGSGMLESDDNYAAIFLQGMNYMRMQQYDDAAVSFRYITVNYPEFPYAWFELAIAADQLRDTNEADEAWDKYVELIPEEYRLERSNDANCLWAIVDLGDYMGVYGGGPGSTPKIAGAEGYQTVDYEHQKRTTGGVIAHAAKELLSNALKEAARSNAIGQMFLGSSEDDIDIRYWFSLSQSQYMCMIPFAGEPNTIVMDTADDDRRYSEHYSQVWHYITGMPHSQAKPLVMNTAFGYHNENVEHYDPLVLKRTPQSEYLD